MVMGPFQFKTNPAVLFGPGRISELVDIVDEIGCNIILVTGAMSLKSSPYYAQVLEDLEKHEINFYEVMVAGEPSPVMIDQTVSDFREESIHAVVAIGGGSVIDAGKAISAMLPQKESVFDFLEGVGKKEHNGIKAPFIAVPTTAGTGSEATKNAVLSHIGADGFKKSLRHDNFIPDAAIIDPNLTLSCPPDVTASCGLDAFTQLLESYLSPKASPMTDALAFDALALFQGSLEAAVSKGDTDIQARSALSYASYISGITLANAGLGAIHGFASSIGGYFNIPHGVICGTLLGATIRANISKLLKLGIENNLYLEKYAKVGKLLSGKHNGGVEAGTQALTDIVDDWIHKFKIPFLSDFGITENDLTKILTRTENKNNPVILDQEDLTAILESRIK